MPYFSSNKPQTINTMTAYQSRKQIKTLLQEMIPAQVTECKKCDKLPQPLVDLIMHNFQAKYVCYHKDSNTVEVGIEEQETSLHYPKIKSMHFKLEEAASWLGERFRNEEQDLRFYAQLIANEGYQDRIQEVILV